MASSFPEPLPVRVTSLRASYGSGPVLRDVSLDVAPGEIVALLGPSGCGKTTLLRCIAGLETPEAGEITIGTDVMSRPGNVVAPERRRIGMVFQDGALFSHMSVAANIGYGLPRGERRGEAVERLLRLVGLEGMADRLPGTLSGGQQQRVALARALAPRPGVLLLDEPFSSLDAALRVQLRTEVRRLLREVEVTVVFVTHDQQEALTFGDRVAVMRDGRIEQIAAPTDLYARPATAWVAGFVGEANLLAGRLRSATIADTAIGEIVIDEIDDFGSEPCTGRLVEVLCRPEHVALCAGGPLMVEGVEYFGQDTRYAVRSPDGTALAARAAGPPAHRVGDSVTATFVAGQARAWLRPAPA